MNEFIDIYAKLVIAIISFIAPVIVFLLSIFSDGIAITKRRAQEQEKQIGELLKTQITETGAVVNKIITESNDALRQNEKKNNRRLQLLNPKRQIYRIFSSLALSLLFIMIDMLIKDKQFNLYNHTTSVILILMSFAWFVIGLLILKQVAWAIIDTKRIIADYNSAVTIKSENVKEN